MTTTAIREKLYDYIWEADDKQITAIYKLFENQIKPLSDWSEDQAFVAELDERVERFEKGIDRAFTWDELETAIADMKKKRAAK